MVFSLIEWWRNLRLSCSPRNMNVTRSESLVCCQCVQSWRKSKQSCKPHHISATKDTLFFAECEFHSGSDH